MFIAINIIKLPKVRWPSKELTGLREHSWFAGAVLPTIIQFKIFNFNAEGLRGLRRLTFNTFKKLGFQNSPIHVVKAMHTQKR